MNDICQYLQFVWYGYLVRDAWYDDFQLRYSSLHVKLKTTYETIYLVDLVETPAKLSHVKSVASSILDWNTTKWILLQNRDGILPQNINEEKFCVWYANLRYQVYIFNTSRNFELLRFISQFRDNISISCIHHALSVVILLQ